MRVLVIALFVSLPLVSCASGRGVKERPPVPPMQSEAAAPPKDSHLDDVKKAASEQLECPIEQVNVTCLRRDATGDCISVRADGCDKTFEYQFGDV